MGKLLVLPKDDITVVFYTFTGGTAPSLDGLKFYDTGRLVDGTYHVYEDATGTYVYYQKSVPTGPPQNIYVVETYVTTKANEGLGNPTPRFELTDQFGDTFAGADGYSGSVTRAAGSEQMAASGGSFVGAIRAQSGVTWDSDALTYLVAVETADGQALEDGVKIAFNNFVIGCKTDGIWNSIVNSCVFAGARTVAGAIVPLIGQAPTNNNFVNGDYDRKLGLKGDASTKRIDTIGNNLLSQNNNHIYARVTVVDTTGVSSLLMGTSQSQTGSNSMRRSATTPLTFFSMSNSASNVATTEFFNGCGMSRSSGTEFTRFLNGTSTLITQASQTPRTQTIGVFGPGRVSSNFNGRVAVYSIGAAIDLSTLDSRVTTLLSELSTAIA